MVRPPTAPVYVVAIDGSAPSKKALEHAAAMAGRDRAQLLIVNVQRLASVAAEPAAGMSTFAHTGEWLERESQTLLEEAQGRARHLGASVAVATLPPADPGPAIVRHAEAARASRVVVGSHGRTGIRRILLGSVAERVVRLAHCPVLVVR